MICLTVGGCKARRTSSQLQTDSTTQINHEFPAIFELVSLEAENGGDGDLEIYFKLWFTNNIYEIGSQEGYTYPDCSFIAPTRTADYKWPEKAQYESKKQNQKFYPRATFQIPSTCKPRCFATVLIGETDSSNDDILLLDVVYADIDKLEVYPDNSVSAKPESRRGPRCNDQTIYQYGASYEYRFYQRYVEQKSPK